MRYSIERSRFGWWLAYDPGEPVGLIDTNTVWRAWTKDRLIRKLERRERRYRKRELDRHRAGRRGVRSAQANGDGVNRVDLLWTNDLLFGLPHDQDDLELGERVMRALDDEACHGHDTLFWDAVMAGFYGPADRAGDCRHLRVEQRSDGWACLDCGGDATAAVTGVHNESSRDGGSA
jgi:hypothetical protein